MSRIAAAGPESTILPVSSIQKGCYGIRDVALSVPTVMGRKGVLGTVEIELWPKEKIALQRDSGFCQFKPWQKGRRGPFAKMSE